MPKGDDPLYMISIVAQMLSIHPQTLRLYEREGFIRPSRTDGNTRLYSPRDVEKLKLILRLTRESGVNLAGVEVILRMRDKMREMQEELDRLHHELYRYTGKEFVETDASHSKSPSQSLPDKVIKIDIEAD